jgi:hypothetical protein
MLRPAQTGGQVLTRAIFSDQVKRYAFTAVPVEQQKR